MAAPTSTAGLPHHCSHLLTAGSTHSLTHSQILNSLAQGFTHTLTHSRIHSRTYSRIHSFTHSLTDSFCGDRYQKLYSFLWERFSLAAQQAAAAEGGSSARLRPPAELSLLVDCSTAQLLQPDMTADAVQVGQRGRVLGF